nr:MAG TPA: hypothetical protein [Caudoviricetes sp.]
MEIQELCENGNCVKSLFCSINGVVYAIQYAICG